MRWARVWALGVVVALVGSTALAQGFGRGRFRGGPGGGRLFLLRIDAVQRELKLDDTQLDRLRQIEADWASQRRSPADLRNLTEEQRREWFERSRKQHAHMEKRVTEILDAKQAARLRQIEVQREGIRIIHRKDIADELRLTSDQRQRVQATVESEHASMREILSGVRSGGEMTPDQRDEFRRKFGELRSGTDARLNAILTESQRRQFQSMQGAPFTFPPREFRGRPGRSST